MFQTSSSEIFSFSLFFSVIFQCTIYFLCLAFNRWFWRNVSEGPSSCIDKGRLCCVRHTLREPHAQIRNMIYHGPILRLTVFGIVLQFQIYWLKWIFLVFFSIWGVFRTHVDFLDYLESIIWLALLDLLKSMLLTHLRTSWNESKNARTRSISEAVTPKLSILQ